MRSYFVAVRKIGDKTYCLAESRRRRGAGYIWVRTVGGLQSACLFESRPRAEGVVQEYSKTSDLVPEILEVQEQTHFVATCDTYNNVYWLEGTQQGTEMTYRWGMGEKAEQKAHRFLTRKAAEAVMAKVRPVRGGVSTVVDIVDRVVVS